MHIDLSTHKTVLCVAKPSGKQGLSVLSKCLSPSRDKLLTSTRKSSKWISFMDVTVIHANHEIKRNRDLGEIKK